MASSLDNQQVRVMFFVVSASMGGADSHALSLAKAQGQYSLAYMVDAYHRIFLKLRSREG